jgi:hypothetical protein
VPLLRAEEEAHEGLEPEIRRVGMGEGEQVEGVQIRLAVERRSDAARQKVTVERGVVRHESPPRQQTRHGRRDLGHRRRVCEIGLREPRQPLDRAGRGTHGPHETPRCTRPALPGVEQDGSELQELGLRILDEPRGLQIHHRHGPHVLHPGPQHLHVEPQLPRVVIPNDQFVGPPAGGARRHHSFARLRLAARACGACVLVLNQG